MASVIYLLCAAAAGLCTWLLGVAYLRSRYRLLLWSAICFLGLTINNAILVVDKIVLPDVDLSLVRTGTALIAMIILIYGLIWDRE